MFRFALLLVTSVLAFTACGEDPDARRSSLETREQSLCDGSEYVWIKNANGACWDTYNGAHQGGLVEQYSCYDDAFQHFTRQWLGGGQYQLVNRATGLCLDLPGGSLADGENFQLWPCHGGPNQRFRQGATQSGTGVTLILAHSNKCADIPWGHADPQFLPQQFTCHGGPAQSFEIQLPPSQWECWI